VKLWVVTGTRLLRILLNAIGIRIRTKRGFLLRRGRK
jgi:hypothetical protein